MDKKKLLLWTGLAFALGGVALFWFEDDPDSDLEYDESDPEENAKLADAIADPQTAAAAAAAQLGLISPLPQGYRATRPFGRILAAFKPYKPDGTPRLVFHAGVDMGAPQGTPIYAVADGKVTTSKAYVCGANAIPCPSSDEKVKCNCWNGYRSAGEGIWISHPQFGNKSWSGYLHLAERYKQVGDEVKQGDIIGTVGNTGASTSPHLHFEVMINNKNIDPTPHLPEHAVDHERLRAKAINPQTGQYWG